MSLLVATQAACNSTYSWYIWAKNSFNQDPCVVAAGLLVQCPGNPILPPLVPNPNVTDANHYLGPSPDNQSSCSCSNILYNLVSACGDCQVGNIVPTAWPSYQDWAKNCTSPNLGNNYVYNVPANSSIPIWATITAADTEDSHWSFGLSYALARGRVVLANSTIPTSPPTPSPLEQNSNSDAACVSKGKLIGIAVGSGLGGLLVAFAIVGCTIFGLRKKKKSSRGPSHQQLPQKQQTESRSLLSHPARTLTNRRSGLIVEPFLLNTLDTPSPAHSSTSDRKPSLLHAPFNISPDPSTSEPSMTALSLGNQSLPHHTSQTSPPSSDAEVSRSPAFAQ